MRVETVTPELVDERGEIRNVAHAGNVAVLTSKRGSVRSNHLHREGWHWLLVVKGLMRYLEKVDNVIVERVIVPGERVFTGPGVPHRTEFLEDSIVVSFAPEKSHASHEADLLRVEW